MLRIGVIGYGFRIGMVIDIMQTLKAGTEIVAIADPKADEIKQQMCDKGQDVSAITFYHDADTMLDAEQLDGAMIGTRCSLHAKMAVKVLNRNLPLFLEKPIATNMADLIALRDAAEKSTSKVVVSFPLRVTPHVALVKEIIDSGKLGTIEHMEAYNNVPYGSVYFQDWYRDENETGGLFLQKATHDIDYINYLLGTRPVLISAMTSKRVFKGDHPAGLYCKDCGEKSTCTNSPYNPFMKHPLFDTPPENLKCAFAVDTGNEDSGSALIQYESGMHVSYTQDFLVRNKAAKRGATLIGYKGTVEFDWFTDEVKVYMHHTPRVESYKIDTSAMSHGGGDIVLTQSFINCMNGKAKSVSSIDDGLLSVLMCLKAKESAATKTFQAIKYPDR